jgi:DHA2 family multidrug resistance protein
MLDRGEQLGWFGSSEIIAETIISVAGFYFFFAHSLTTDNPFIRFELFKDRSFVGAVIFMVVIGLVLYATMALVTPYMQNVLGYPILTSGFLLGARGIGTLFSMMAVGRLLRFIEARTLVGVGMLLTAGTLYQMVGFNQDTAAHTIVTVSIVQGVGLGLVFVPLSTVAFMTLAGHLRTEGSAMLTLVRNIGSSVGISIVIANLTSKTTVMHERLGEYVTPFNNALQMPDVANTLQLGTEAGKALLDQIVTLQANVIAYSNDFVLLMWLTLATIPLLLIIGTSKSRTPVRSVREGVPPKDEPVHALD